jgi:glutamine amidotransferase
MTKIGKNIGIIDNNLSNIDSVLRAIKQTDCDPFIIRSGEQSLFQFDKIILPGVGAIADGMHFLSSTGLDNKLIEFAINYRKPILGICLGMQILGINSEENGGTNGLGIVPGSLRRLKPQLRSERVPHVGWNSIEIKNNETPLLEGIQSGQDFYFVHSYAFQTSDEPWVAAETVHCGQFVSIIASDNIYGCQFHPEKSQQNGQRILKNFVENC